MTPRRSNRRGLAIVPAFVCLVLVTLFCGVLLKLAASHRVLVRSESRKTQADWLVESGLERASARLSVDPQYRGETWELAANEMAGGKAAVVRINVETLNNDPKRRRVRVEADYPRDDTLRARSSSTRNIELEPVKPGGSS